MTRAAVAAAAIALAAGCARHVPPDPPTAALYRDLQRIVTVAEATGWDVDRLQLEALLAPALDSVCRVDPVRRRDLVAWLELELARAGGPVEEAWRRAGKRLGRIGDLLTLTRIHALLQHAARAADADCPFWIEPDPRFRGRQISDGRWQVSFGGGGKGTVVSQGDRLDIQFGGAGRLLLGRVLTSRSALYAGGEIGASASFPRDEAGERGELIFGFDLVAPLVYRFTFVNTYLEAEAGWLGHVTEEDLRRIDHGIHVGAAFGGRATRTRFLFPGAAFGVAFERTFPDEGPPLVTVKVGFRVAFDLDL